jgi:rhamnogalacturonyl hydrolase YesR
MMKRILIAMMVATLLPGVSATASQQDRLGRPSRDSQCGETPGIGNAFAQDQILALMRKVNAYALAHPLRETDRDWIRATWYSGVMEAYHATGDARYLQQAQTWAEKHTYQIGTEQSGFNRMFCAMTWLELYLLEPDAKKIQPTIEALNAQLPWSPALGKVWYGHAPNQKSIQHVYADGLYAASTLVMLHRATGDRKYLDFLDDAFWKVTETILDKEDNLYYRDPSYIGKKSPNGGRIFWSRGNGWVFAGLARVIRNLSKDDPYYDHYVDHFRRMAQAIAAAQQDDGFWRANLGDAQHYLMPESSGTAFFVDGFGQGVRMGVLDRDIYLPVIIRGWNALVTATHADGLLGWVQPVDAEPRPSHPRSTQEYGAGLFLSAGSQVYRLVKDGVITANIIQAVRPRQSRMLPPAALRWDALTKIEHPLAPQISRFLKDQKASPITQTGYRKKDYLEVIARQVKAMRPYQDAQGRIIDPVGKAEKYFATPCYAHSVAVLVKAGYPIDAATVESGMKALDVSLASLIAGNVPDQHGDFFTWPLALACELFDQSAPEARKQAWEKLLGQISPERAYSGYKMPLDSSDHGGFYKLYETHFANNWNLVNVAGEWARVKRGLGDSWYVDYCLTMQLANFSSFGMYNEKGSPLAYDLFPRHYLTGMLHRGYDSFLYATYRDILWRGAWTSLFMQSPFGELPTGYRSSQHIWNEAQQAVIFEIYATAYAKEGRMLEAGAFKRAAHLALGSIRNWTRPDGSGFIVKNRYPIAAKHGYEDYSSHACYNMLAMSMLAQAWQYADDAIEEQPAPADIGGFVLAGVAPFHKVFANAGGNYIEYDAAGDHLYNPTGLIRIHLKNGHPQLGPSDGCAAKFSGQGVNFAVGPAWRINGKWKKLADCKGDTCKVTLLEESPQRVRFEVAYSGVNQKFTIDQTGLIVEDTVNLESVDAMRVYYPMLVFDGEERTGIIVSRNRIKLSLAGKSMTFLVKEPGDAVLHRSGNQLNHRNGIVEDAFVEAPGKRMIYRISAE